MALYWTGPPKGEDVSFKLDALTVSPTCDIGSGSESQIPSSSFVQKCSYVEVSISSDSSTSSSTTNDCTFEAELILTEDLVSVGDRLVLRLQWTVGASPFLKEMLSSPIDIIPESGVVNDVATTAAPTGGRRRRRRRRRRRKTEEEE